MRFPDKVEGERNNDMGDFRDWREAVRFVAMFLQVSDVTGGIDSVKAHRLAHILREAMRWESEGRG